MHVSENYALFVPNNPEVTNQVINLDSHTSLGQSR